jgi:hypothetical protein
MFRKQTAAWRANPIQSCTAQRELSEHSRINMHGRTFRAGIHRPLVRIFPI